MGTPLLGWRIRGGQERSVSIRGDFERVYNASLEVMARLPKANIVCEDRTKGEIVGKTKGSLQSWGELVTVKVSRVDDSQSSIRVRSEPKVKATKIDYGKGVENVEAVLKAIQAVRLEE
jgi:hypothetical protein